MNSLTEDLDRIFRSEDRDLLERLARAAQEMTGQYHGNAIALYAPLYISNYCSNRCVYCGFRADAGLKRKRLTLEEVGKECRALSETGIRSCLLLTGESRRQSPPSYIKEAVRIACRYFTDVSLEIYPLDVDEYRELYRAGADGVTIYQETYDRRLYDELHLAGPKKDYDYRFQAPERIAQAGFRHIGMGALLGLADWREDVPRLFSHLRYMEKTYPGVEYSLSFPRIRPVEGDPRQYHEVSDRDMVRIISVARLLFPRSGINLSTRETGAFRDRVIGFGITKMSAGSSTRVGGYAEREEDYDDGQFQVHDTRSLPEIKSMLTSKGYDPVITDWRNIVND
ncbi:MAG: 2-iminoacetate synthase [Syntrophorhabdus sp. PtaU1.Bin058]|nr:MAG: 2-iminoacetate synthase [Syntrophorhabdus sp. PtaU1.Bin058]